MRPISAMLRWPAIGQFVPSRMTFGSPAPPVVTPPLVHVPAAVTVTTSPTCSVTPVDCHIPTRLGLPAFGAATTATAGWHVCPAGLTWKVSPADVPPPGAGLTTVTVF